jgi:hypothetical protein
MRNIFACLPAWKDIPRNILLEESGGKDIPHKTSSYNATV